MDMGFQNSMKKAFRRAVLNYNIASIEKSGGFLKARGRSSENGFLTFSYVERQKFDWVLNCRLRGNNQPITLSLQYFKSTIARK